MYRLLELLKLKNNPHHHWSDSSGYSMAEFLEHVGLKELRKSRNQQPSSLSLQIEWHQWIAKVGSTCTNTYVLIGNEPPSLFALEHVVEQSTFDNLTNVILNAMREYGGFSIVVICARFITFGGI